MHPPADAQSVREFSEMIRERTVSPEQKVHIGRHLCHRLDEDIKSFVADMTTGGENAPARIFCRDDFCFRGGLGKLGVVETVGDNLDPIIGRQRSQYRGGGDMGWRGDNDSGGTLQRVLEKGGVKEPHSFLPHDIGMPANDPRNPRRQHHGGEVRHRVREVQVHEVELSLAVQTASLSRQTRREGQRAVDIPTGRANNRNSSSCAQR